MCKYICCAFVLVVICVSFSIIAYSMYFSRSSVFKFSDIEKCPYCYGQSVCDNISKLTYKKTFFASLINAFNTKNVFFADFNAVDVIIKKLGSDVELNALDDLVCRDHNVATKCDVSELKGDIDYGRKVWHLLNDSETSPLPFKMCSESAAKAMFVQLLSLKTNDVSEGDFLKNLWTMLQVNVEPLMLQLLNAEGNWPVPMYYGSCGRLIVEENCGSPLTYKEDLDWMDRAWLSLQLLQAARNFTSNHPDFRFYLGDWSSDNVVVDADLRVTIVDLENMVVTQKRKPDNFSAHQSEVLSQEDGFAYAEDEICSHSVSDHNYYAVCTVLLGRKAKWPMMENGLLHSPPDYVLQEHKDLFDLIEECATPSTGFDRFTISDEIMNILSSILTSRSSLRQNLQNRTDVVSERVDL